MTLEQLQYFLSAAEHLSFSRASQEHFIHQSAAAKSVAKLEEKFNLRLFERSNRYLELTEAGRLLQKQAKELLQHSVCVQESMHRYAAGDVGSLKLIATNLHFMRLLDIYFQFREKHSGIRWELPPCTEDLADEPRLQVLQKNADLGIISSLPALEPELGQFYLYPEHICLILPSEHPMAKKKQISLRQLDQLELVDSARWARFPLAGLGEAFERQTGYPLHLKTPGYLLHPGKELLSYLRANQCATPVPYSVAAHTGQDHSLLRITDYQPDYAVWLIWRKDNQNPSLSLFLKEIQSYKDSANSIC